MLEHLLDGGVGVVMVGNVGMIVDKNAEMVVYGSFWDGC